MNAQQFLAGYNLTVADAFDWVAANISHPDTVFQVCKQVGITTSMLTEIIDYQYPAITADVVTNFFASCGMNCAELDSAGSPTSAPESVGEAAANETIDGLLHWQKDHDTYLAAWQAIYAQPAALSYAYQDLFATSENPNVASATTPGFMTIKSYLGHTWSLSEQETADFQHYVNGDFFEQGLAYLQAGNLSGYQQFCDSQISLYDNLVAQAPDFSSHWI